MKKLLLSLLFALVALTGLQAQTIWDGTADTSWYDETSTEFEISTAEQLAGLAELVNNGNDFSYQTVRLTADIVLNDTSNWGNWESSAPNNTWTPIGANWNVFFSGTFDGQGHTVSGIYINTGNGGNQGLFGINSGTIKNVEVKESYIRGSESVGGVCSLNNGTISDCYNSGTVSGNSNVGGVCGENYGTISNCYNTGTVNGNYYVGGVCGRSYGSISNCYNSGTVSGNYYVGGVCGENWGGTISNCYYLQGTAEGGINGSDISGQAAAKTAEQFASGEVCWLLNGSSDENPVWFQTLDTDDYPVLDDAHNIVYAKGKCPNSKDNTYSNQGPSQVGAHTDNDNDGRCDFCEKIMTSEPAQKDGVYQICNRAELYWFAGLVNGTLSGVEQNGSVYAVLTADIIINENVLDAEGNLTVSTDNLLVWSPIGNNRNEFYGIFDGQGHTVSGIYINSENDYQGLFGYNSGTIKNVGVSESFISGNDNVGGVCGHNYDGTISNCYNSGNVSGTSVYAYIGGVCGNNNNNGTISNCYNTGTVSGTGTSPCVGGMSGFNEGTISNCYNTGIVSGGSSVGGVCGRNYDGTISNCYYLEGTADGGIYGSDVSGQAEVKTAEQFASGEVCWLLNGSSDANPVWFQTLDTDDYPVLDDAHATVYTIGNCPNDTNNTYSNQGPSNVGEHADNDNDGRCDFCGKLMPREPNQIEGFYQISNRAELYWFAGLVNGTLSGVEQNTAANAVLTADIIINENVLDAEGNLTVSTDNLLVWSPIGNNRNEFYGIFDGQGYIVKGIYINTVNSGQGLFGYNSGTIKNVGVSESFISGNDNVGGVCGNNEGTISNCYNTGTVSGGYDVGGVCGFNEGTISNCYNSGYISGGLTVGGVCGLNSTYGTIYSCYNSGNVSGTGDYYVSVGGVCGDNDGKISNCYNFGTVSGNNGIGGVCGDNDGKISNCYNFGTVSGNNGIIGGVCGRNYGSISNCYYLQGTAEGGINGNDEIAQAEVKTAEQFASGEVCWLLNSNSDQNHVWFQTLDTDDYPVLDEAHATVYVIGNCPNDINNSYNNQGPSQIGAHTDNDNDGRCDFCGKIMISEPTQKDGVYQISNRAELYWFAGLVNGTLSGVEQNIYANAVLTADIIINENVLEDDGNLTANTEDLLIWNPIGKNYDKTFRGTFDGQGHTVSGIYINSSDYGYQGLFGYNGGTIKNAGITESYIKGGYYVGGVCGENNGTISNCHNSGAVHGSDDYVGGVCGDNSHGTISNCHNSGTVHGNNNIGGVCGNNYGTISNCYNSGTVNGNNNIGSVCGSNSSYGTISNCYNSGTVIGGGYCIGSVCGYNHGTISNCYNSGTVSGNNNVGGICGSNSSYGSISNCYNSGTVSGNNNVGGVCGYNPDGIISNCYYLQDTATGGINGNDVSGQAEVKTAEEFASGEVCWLLNEEQSEGAWGQKIGTDPCPVLGGPAVFKDGETYYNEEGSAIIETNSEQASFVIVSENLTINIYGSDDEATVYNLAGNIVYQGIERIIPVPNPGMYMVRIGNEVQKTVVR